MKKPIIYIAYTNTGAGHIMPAKTIAKAIEEMYPNRFNVVMSNFFEDAGEYKFNNHIEESLNTMIKYPIIAKILHAATNAIFLISPYYIQIFHRKVFQRCEEYIKSLDIDIFFTTHFFTYSVAIDAKKQNGFKYPIVGLNPDTFDTFSQWSRKGDLLVVCSDMACKKALKFGHNKNKLKIVPQILRSEFVHNEETSKEAMRREYGIREHTFTILMSDGGQGCGKNYATLKVLLKHNISANVIFICGKNDALYADILALQEQLKKEKHKLQILAFSFVDSVAPLIQMSDLFIGKAGPATILECLNLRLPVLINLVANNAERKTAKYFKNKGVAISCNVIPLIGNKVKKIMKDRQILDNIRYKISNLDIFENGSATIAQLLVDMLEKNMKK